MNLGFEIEFTGVSVVQVINTLECYFRKDSIPMPQPKHPERKQYSITDGRELTWTITEDTSIKPTCGNRTLASDKYEYMCELISPVLNSENLYYLYDILTILQGMGAVVNETCGCHIHIDMQDDFKWVDNLLNKAFKEQYRVLNWVGSSISRRWLSKPYPKDFIEKYEKSNITSVDELLNFLYDELSTGVDRETHPNPARVYWLNLDSVVRHNTIEFRMFNSTLSPMVLQTYVKFVEDFICEV